MTIGLLKHKLALLLGSNSFNSLTPPIMPEKPRSQDNMSAFRPGISMSTGSVRWFTQRTSSPTCTVRSAGARVPSNLTSWMTAVREVCGNPAQPVSKTNPATTHHRVCIRHPLFKDYPSRRRRPCTPLVHYSSLGGGEPIFTARFQRGPSNKHVSHPCDPIGVVKVEDVASAPHPQLGLVSLRRPSRCARSASVPATTTATHRISYRSSCHDASFASNSR